MTNRQALVLMTDFGVRDGAVAAMKGVALHVDSGLSILDLTHEVKPFDIWEGAYRLLQTHSYWRDQTVFVVVIDPGVGTNRKSLAAKLNNGQIIVCPDNGLLTWLEPCLKSIREIDESKHRLPGSSDSYTFLGRDLYAYVGAKLASGQLGFEAIGQELSQFQQLEIRAATLENGVITGVIPVLDINFGNVWTNIPKTMLETSKILHKVQFDVRILEGTTERFTDRMPFVHSFGAVEQGQPLIYINSLLQAAIAINCQSFADKYQISSGADWSVELRLV